MLTVQCTGGEIDIILQLQGEGHGMEEAKASTAKLNQLIASNDIFGQIIPDCHFEDKKDDIIN